MIFHVAERDAWGSPDTYRPASLTEEGFIHCSTAAQLIEVANGRFAGRTDLLLVTIEPDLLHAPVVFEDCYESGRRFPHIYGAIDPGAVVSVEPFLPDATGRFSWGLSVEA
jgi:uncharacterized protein (DUF952 family)